MPHRDARSLDHKTLAEIRTRAVEQVQAGESPETIIRALGFSRSCIYTWLARYRAAGWAGLQAKALAGRPMKITPDAVDLRHGDAEEPAAVPVRVRVVDA
jgi:transposase